ncbi:NAD-dependent deacylase [Halomarina oriensis]|uniref:NAD-dependent protein deacylase n=1 Tax=Halomarina oriensis TaxID=671145 RepID=A0A6B0GIF7_9EURY|nr:NAD-dependent deacylase [Halomarina oriensis]MWG33591.1 NAD-dependent protein deacylase [Halomarina oriensis]
MTDDATIEALADTVRAAESVVAFTGAGVSTASGIPDFRGEDGLWNRYDTNDFHVRRLRADPAGFWVDRLDLAEELAADVGPNPAHEALARLEAAGHLDAVVTQNVDGLHRAAGSEDVIELHGDRSRVVCLDCGDRSDAEAVRERVRDGERPPRCDCGGLLKPDVVLFGEQLPVGAMQRAQSLARGADVFLAVGSSLSVEPAAGLPRTAAAHGATLAIVNLDETPLSDRAAFDVRDDVTDVLPRLADRVV